ncbi:CNG04540-like protein [Papiliotrema laurentii]|uniref:Ubiquitin carboxyl-terminal hydrolase n=1 Tax=Papiliotrema laurentii TaxID=5418 RepID=A0AAD9FUI0_PAPLA|nr:CNG04540-like protein [Papiliotrema laurentii]
MSATIPVVIKHAGRSFPIDVNPSASPSVFKDSIYQVTGVPTDRMKVMTKGGLLKDTSDMSKIGFKEGQVITVIGTAGPLPTGPSAQPVFVEDLDANQAALVSGEPAGLVNLGQTCYLNSSLQVLRNMPQLRTALTAYQGSGSSLEGGLTTSLKNLFVGMSQTTEPVAPFFLLNSLRTLAPQFSEQDRSGGFAQQDADEAWTALLSALRASLPASDGGSFVDRQLSVRLQKTLRCAENEEEPPSTTVEQVLKLECNISISTNFLISGILDNLDQQIEKNSPSLGRSATYTQKTRISRLPQYLVVHMVRFYWRRDIQKKAKIMRKVKFPLQLDLLDLLTDDLRQKVQPINTAARQILKDRDDRAKIAKRDRKVGDFQAEEIKLRNEEATALRQLSVKDESLEADSNASGIYELCGMITHKGASADSGHYIGWTRKEDSFAPSGEEEWYKFDDDKVSTITAEKILSMDGGGEDSVAYILLYRSAI